MDETFLITGGQGFLGAWVARVLLEDGARFVTLDRTPRNDIIFQVLEPEHLERVRRVFVKLGDPEALKRILREQAVTRVIHLAPSGGVFAALSSLRDQVAMTVYLAGEGSAEEASVPSVGLRTGTIYGVGLETGPSSAPTRAIKAAVLRRRFTIPFTGSCSFTYVEDAARLIVRLARSSHQEALTIRLPTEESTVEAFIAGIERVIPRAKGQITCAGEARASAVEIEETLIEEVIGVAAPTTPLQEGIRRTAHRFLDLAEGQRLREGDLGD